MANIVLDRDTFRQVAGEDHEDWELIEEDGWDDEGRYQSTSFVVKYIPTGKFYRGSYSRSGSYFTDWEYEYYDTTLYEVEEVTETRVITTWKAVKQV